ncbi:MAG: hypothetical protein EHM46_05185, partial [Bacteroidetes bacterium]
EYSINGGADFFPDPVFTGLPAGNYQTVVRDATGCTASGNLNVITQPARIKIVSFIKVDITTCNDAGEGRIIISGSGGKGVLTYILDGTINQSSGDFQNLPGGPHQVSIRDENGCTRDTSVVIQAPPAIIADQIMITDVTGCSDDSNGMIQVTGSGGTGSITYSLDGGPFQATGDFAGLLQGDYTITLRDDNDCTMDTLVSVGGPAPIVILSEMVTDITCSGAGDGIIEVIASGGTMPLEYTLDPGAAVSPVGEFTGLGPGIYTVSINDAQGCGPVISSPFNLPDPPLLVVDSVRISEISCHDAGDGEIRVYATGGVEPFQFSADNQGSWQEDSIFSGLGPDTYEVYIRDANHCIRYAGSFPLAEPPEIILAVAVTDVSTCAGDTTGVIEGTASGGTGQIVYSLDGLNYSPSGTFINLAGGLYTIYARDERGCSVSEPVSVNEPAPVTAVVTKTDATFGNLGSISISGSSGGTSPYTYSILGPTGEFSADTAYTMLMAGDYHVVVLDQNGCTYEELVAILDVLPLNVTVNLTPVSCYGASDGVVQFVPLDAEGSVEYSIDSGLTFVPGSLFENLPGNMTYYLVARDG